MNSDGLHAALLVGLDKIARGAVSEERLLSDCTQAHADSDAAVKLVDESMPGGNSRDPGGFEWTAWQSPALVQEPIFRRSSQRFIPEAGETLATLIASDGWSCSLASELSLGS